jgi:hypothetical protein
LPNFLVAPDGKPINRLVEYEDATEIRCEMCEDWWCVYHDEHFYDCECILEEWMDELDGFGDLIHQYGFKIKELPNGTTTHPEDIEELVEFYSTKTTA